MTEFSSVHLLSYVLLFATPWTAARQASLSITNSWSLLKLLSIEMMMYSNHLILFCPLLLPHLIFLTLRSFPMSQFFASGGKSWSFSFSISPSNEHSGLICFRIDWFHLILVQCTLRVLSNPTVQNHKFFCYWLSL